MKRGNGGYLGPRRRPTLTAASGMWSIAEQHQFRVNAVWPVAQLPGAPTIGTAIVSNGQAVIAFTPPTVGYPATFTYTATSSPGGLTGRSGAKADVVNYYIYDQNILTTTNSSGPITVDNLVAGTNYTFTVTAANPTGTGTASGISNGVTLYIVPGTPTIGTATSTGPTTATVAYTAPASNGGSVITSYTAVSSPGSINGTLTQAGSGTITVSGLNPGTSYTFTVYATNFVGNSPNSAASNSITTTVIAPTTVEYLVVAGGGGGGGGWGYSSPGGGGAGGMLTSTTLAVGIATPYTVTVGAGGIQGISQGIVTGPTSSTQGSNSVFASITAIGGGYGSLYAGGSGGSGGGGGYYSPSGGSGTAGQGNNGGNAFGSSSDRRAPGSGGGAGASGINGTSRTTPANGAIGLQSSINGASTYYAGGGAAGSGGYDSPSGFTGAVATGGLGGGGDGGRTNKDGTPNTGGGGGGGVGDQYYYTSGGNGGSGLVVVAYTTNYLPLNYVSPGLTYAASTTARSGYRVYTFTAGTGSVSWATNNTVPGAPQNVVAYPAPAGPRTASVMFTAAYNGGSAITSYTATSSPGNITGTASTSPITVTGLTDGTAYTFTVYATNSIGNGQVSIASNSITNGDLYYSSVGLLLKTNSTNGLTNNTFLDAANNFTVTRNGNTAMSYFNPYGLGIGSATGSGYFDGTGDFLTVADNAAFQPESGDFTYEAWVYLLSVTGTIYFWSQRSNLQSAQGAGAMLVSQSGDLRYQIGRAVVTSSLQINASTGFTMTVVNAWQHLALVRSGNTVTAYLNGSAGTPVTVATGAIGTSGDLALMAGNSSVGSNPVTGYMSDFRMVKGTAIVPPSGGPTAPLSAVPNTGLLINFNMRTNAGIYDASPYSTIVNSLLVETFGSTQASTDTAKWASTSMRFNGTTDYLSVLNATTSLTFGTGDFTIEMWVWPSSTTACTLIDFRPVNSSVARPVIIIAATTNVVQYVLGTTTVITGTTAITLNAWNHVAVARSNGVTKLYLNGVQEGDNYEPTTNFGVTYGDTTAGRPIIGAQGYSLGSAKFNGYIQDLRVTIGVARYTSTPFTTPTIEFIAATTSGNIPNPPTIGTATTVSATSATVSFTQPNSDGGAAIISYIATATPGGTIGILNQSGSGTITVNGLAQGTGYTFTVYANNSIGNSAKSSASNSITTLTVPGAPTIGTATVTGTTTATVAYTAPASNGGNAITSYTATSSPGGITGTLSQAGSGTITVSGLAQGTAYTFTVYATSIAGNSANSGVSNSITTYAVPGAPTIGTATRSASQSVQVTFTAPSSTGSTVITSYTATSSPGGVTGTGASSPITVTGLTNGTAYTFTVTATNSIGTGPASSASNSATPYTVPGAPTIGTATATGTTTATVAYTAPASNGGDAITSYTATSSPGSITGTLSQAGSGTITVNGLTSGTSYTFTVYATNAAGNSTSSGASNSITTTAIAPSSVEYLVVAGGGGAGQPQSGNNAGGGGGAGGLLTDTALAVSTSSPYIVTIGAGGVAAGFEAAGTAVGSNSTFATITTFGGGAGSGRYVYSSGNGGSGGGGGGLGTAGPPRQGYNGGALGGGGAGAVGGASSGGDGLPSSITGVSTYYAGGGAGSNDGSTGGLGGGGSVGTPYPTPGQSGTPNTGGGGGCGSLTGTGGYGEYPPGGSGGSGIVIIAYPSNYTELTYIDPGLSYNLSTVTRAGYRVYKFTGGTGTVTWATGNTAPGLISKLVARASSSGQIIVTFAAPNYTGGSAITSYTITSSPGNITATGASSPITVTGLTDGTAYTFTAYATNAIGNGLVTNTASNSATIGDVYYSSVGLLLKNNSTSGQNNNSFVDSSSNAFAITRAGTPTGTYFNPYGLRFGSAAGSIFLNGGRLTTAGNTIFNLSSTDFTLELWMYMTANPSGAYNRLITIGPNATVASLTVQISTTGVLTIGQPKSPEGKNTPSTTIPLNTWTHIALVYTLSNTTGTFYVNGSQIGQTTAWTWGSSTTNYFYVGYDTTGTVNAGFSGYVADVRFVRGVVTPTGTGPTSPLTAVANTAILLNFNGQTSAGIYDASSRSLTSGSPVFTVGTAQSSTDTAKWSSTSMVFSSAGTSYLTMPMNSAIQFGTGDFTVECWTYLTARNVLYPCIFSNYNSYAAGALALFAGHNSASTTQYQVAINGTTFPSTAIQSGASVTVIYNAWTHLAVVRSGGVISLYVNGVRAGNQVTSSAALNGVGTNFYVGISGDSGANGYINGYIQDFRVTVGVARYTSTPFTLPTFAFVAATAPVGPANRPIIGTATATSSTAATVSFTQPDSNGGATITSYTAVSSPGGVTGTLSQAGSGTITVNGLSAGTSYTFTVYATNSSGDSLSSNASNSITTYAQLVDYLVVAGGGAGAQSRSGYYTGGGGGAGGMLTGVLSYSVGTSYTVTVGGGGTLYTSGSNSVFATVTSTGGGYGGGSSGSAAVGGVGGSGGGGTGGPGGQQFGGGAGTTGQGNAGGGGASGSNAGAGGGGGAGGAGSDGVDVPNGGAGGIGLQSSITGVSTYYAGGGGGSSSGAGGAGGGGTAAATSAATPTGGSVNTGGGGGAGSRNGGVSGYYAGSLGGSGVVIIAYSSILSPLSSISAGLTYDQPTRSGYRVYRFTAGTGTISW